MSRKVDFKSKVTVRDVNNVTSSEELASDEVQKVFPCVHSFTLTNVESGKIYSSSSSLFLGSDVDIPFCDVLEEVGCFSLFGSVLQLILPRVTKGSCEVLLEVSSSMKFPLKSGDSIEVGEEDGKSTYVLKVDIPRISRSIPKSEKDSFNPAQQMSCISFDTGWQEGRKHRWNGSVESTISSAINHWEFPSDIKEITVGRRGMVCEPDPGLSSHHATIIRHHRFFSLKPSHSSKRVHLLIGQGVEHYRPPVPLRLGDCICIGRSEFCVVFQQRGNRIAFSPKKSVREELQARRQEFTSILYQNKSSLSSKTTVEVSEPLSSSFSGETPPESYVSEEPSVCVPCFSSTAALKEYFQLPNISNEPLMVLMSLKGPMANSFFNCHALETTFGSDESNTIVLPADRRVDQVHCRIVFDHAMERWLLEDLESTNGTFVKVSAAQPLLLCPGDVCIMGLTTIKVSTGSSSSA